MLKSGPYVPVIILPVQICSPQTPLHCTHGSVDVPGVVYSATHNNIIYHTKIKIKIYTSITPTAGTDTASQDMKLKGHFIMITHASNVTQCPIRPYL